MFMSVPWRFPNSHFDNNASYTPYVTAATIALSTQHLSRDKTSWYYMYVVVNSLFSQRKVLSIQGDGAEEAHNTT